jgi:hypothetical protein
MVTYRVHGIGGDGDGDGLVEVGATATYLAVEL